MIVGKDLHHPAHQHDGHREVDKAVGLKDGVAHQHHAHEQGGQTQGGQKGAGQICIQAGEDQGHDGFPQHIQAHRHGTGHQGRDPQGGAGDSSRTPAVPAGQRARYGGDHRRSYGRHQGSRQVIDVQRAVVVAIEGAADALQGGVQGQSGLRLPSLSGHALLQQCHGDFPTLGKGGFPRLQGLLQIGEVYDPLVQGPGVRIFQ